LATVPLEGLVYALGPTGVTVCDGFSAKRMSERVEPLFHAAQAQYSSLGDWCAGVFENRLVFSLRRVGAAANDLTLEYSPSSGWFVPHGFGAVAFAELGGSTRNLYHASPGAAFVFDSFVGGSDDAVAIPSRFQTAWIEPTRQGYCGFRRARVLGRGHSAGPQMTAKLDYSAGDGEQHPLSFDIAAGPLWGTGVWGAFNWADGVEYTDDDVYLDSFGKALSLKFSETSILTATKAALLGSGQVETVGAWALNEIRLDYVPLGLTNS
jgi:hypothetical protein